VEKEFKTHRKKTREATLRSAVSMRKSKNGTCRRRRGAVNHACFWNEDDQSGIRNAGASKTRGDSSVKKIRAHNHEGARDLKLQKRKGPDHQKGGKREKENQVTHRKRSSEGGGEEKKTRSEVGGGWNHSRGGGGGGHARRKTPNTSTRRKGILSGPWAGSVPNRPWQQLLGGRDLSRKKLHKKKREEREESVPVRRR